MKTVTVDDLLLGEPVTTGAWLVPYSLGDCPDDLWPLKRDVVIEL